MGLVTLKLWKKEHASHTVPIFIRCFGNLPKIDSLNTSGVKSETRTRSIVKTLTYRIVVGAMLALITFYVTGNPSTTTIITVLFNLGGAAAYYGFERLWDSISWGRKI